jgi:uncharacterized membrane protein (DUF106 family)
MALNEFIMSNPKTAIILISLLVTIFITVVRYYMTDRERMKEIKERQKELRKEMKEFKNNPEKMMEINKKMLEDMPEQMKMSFKPMIITLIPLLILFKWLWSAFSATSLGGAWLWWYIGSSIVFSIILSKVFGLQ